MSRREDSNKKLKLLAVIFAILFLLSAVLLLSDIWEHYNGKFSGQSGDNTSNVIKYNGNDYIFKDNIETILILGLDTFDIQTDDSAYTNNRQADFLMLLVVDNDKENCSALHINRDTMTKINVLGVAGEKVDTKTQQIALAHTYGNGNRISCRNTADAVSEHLLGVKVDHYISLTMDSVSVINDLVGGVDVEVLDDFSGIDDTLVKGETVTLYGKHALNYVRTRYGMEDSSNQHRMARQKQYTNAFIKKAIENAERDEQFVAQTALAMSKYMVSDCTVTYLENLFDKISEYNFKGISTIEGMSAKGEKFIEFYPDESSVKQTVVELFCRLK